MSHIVHFLSNLNELLANIFEYCAIDNVLVHIFIEKPGGVSYLNRGLDFVSSEDPDFDPGLLEGDNGRGDIVLQFVLDGGRADQSH